MKSINRNWAARAMCAVAITACSGLLSSDGRYGPSIHVSLHRQAPTTVADPMLSVNIGGKTVQLSPPEEETRVHGRRYGAEPVRVVLMSADGDSLATVEFTQRFQRNHEHWVAAMVGPDRPHGICVGVVEARPLRAGSDTLFVMYGSLPHGVIC